MRGVLFELRFYNVSPILHLIALIAHKRVKIHVLRHSSSFPPRQGFRLKYYDYSIEPQTNQVRTAKFKMALWRVRGLERAGRYHTPRAGKSCHPHQVSISFFSVIAAGCLHFPRFYGIIEATGRNLAESLLYEKIFSMYHDDIISRVFRRVGHGNTQRSQQVVRMIWLISNESLPFSGEPDEQN